MGHPDVYLDHFATTPLDRRVLAAMMPYLTERFGNAASQTHRFGWEASEAVDRARSQVAALIGADRREVVFTSGATESNNLVLRGVSSGRANRGHHVISCVTEHPSVLDPLERLTSHGFDVTLLKVDEVGAINLEELQRAIRDDTILVSLMAANNEIGTLHPVRDIGHITRARGIPFHCDAAQAAGKMPLDVMEMQIDLLSISAHKLYGPKGVGALYVRRELQGVLDPLIDGGGHEGGLRSGTLNVPGCVGLGEACKIAGLEMADEAPRLRGLRERLYRRLKNGLPQVTLNGHPEKRLPASLHLTLRGVPAEALILTCEEIAISSGSACSSASPGPSHVLAAIGMTDEEAECSVRLGLGRFTTEEDVDLAADSLIAGTRRVREALDAEHGSPAMRVSAP